MSTYDILKNYIPTYYDDILEINKILESEAIEFESINDNKNDLKTQLFIDTATDIGLSIWEKNILNISPSENFTYAERRSKIKSYLIGQYKFNSSRIKELAEAYLYGEVIVVFTPPNINIIVRGVYGTPPNISEFSNYINTRKPAHLNVTYTYRYYTIGEINNMTLNQLNNTVLDKFTRGG